MKKWWYIGESAALAAADQCLKSYVEENMEEGEEKPITGRIVLRRVKNKGMCLNFLQKKPGVVRTLSLTCALGLTAAQAAALFQKGHFFRRHGLAFLLAGAWSNTFDRLVKNGVTDYIGVKFRSGKLSKITYNLADFYIFAGNVILFLTSVFPSGKRKATKTEKNMVS